jgi:hypothetical protein
LVKKAPAKDEMPLVREQNVPYKGLRRKLLSLKLRCGSNGKTVFRAPRENLKLLARRAYLHPLHPDSAEQIQNALRI